MGYYMKSKSNPKGAGRKPKAKSQKKVPVTFMTTQEVAKLIKTFGDCKGSMITEMILDNFK